MGYTCKILKTTNKFRRHVCPTERKVSNTSRMASFLGTTLPCLVMHNAESASNAIVYKLHLHLRYTHIYIYCMGSNPSQTIPQHARKGNILHFSFDRAGRADLLLCSAVPHPTWERTLWRSRITLMFSPALTFMAFVQENRSFRSLVYYQNFALTNLWFDLRTKGMWLLQLHSVDVLFQTKI